MAHDDPTQKTPPRTPLTDAEFYLEEAASGVPPGDDPGGPCE